MRFAVFIKQNVPWLDVSMQNAVFMRVMHSARYLRDQFHRLPDRYRLAPDHFVKLAAFDELHAEVTSAFALADLVDGNDAWMFEAGSSFRLAAKALQVRFGGPRAQSNHFERDGAIETFLMGAINHALAAPANFLQQLVVAEFGWNLCASPASSSRSGATAALKRHRPQSPCGASAKSLLPHLPQARLTLVVAADTNSRIYTNRFNI